MGLTSSRPPEKPQDRPGRPGRKTLNRLKKAKQLMTRRLANQLRQGREHKIIHRNLERL